jgi:methylase of polypeptide subunit release factors
MQILMPKVHVRAARRLVEPMPWRYSWVRTGPMRLIPMANYWWDGGTDLSIYWATPAAPAPSSWLNGLMEALWQRTTRTPEGLLEPDPAALLVHLAVQACRPGPGHLDDWRHFLTCRQWVEDWARVQTIARHAGVAHAVRRALAAAEAGDERPGVGALYDGARDIVWRLATAVQMRVRPRRLSRLLAGMPVLGDTSIRCRVAGTEVLAGPGVFVPTPDADIFVSMTIPHLMGSANPTIVEVGTGCGAIALALANLRSDAVVHATDLFPAAIREARRNGRRLAADRVQFYAGSLLDPVPSSLYGRVDAILANLPFYPARDYASIGSVPRGTIQGVGDDGLSLVRQLARDAIPFLKPGGRLLLQMFTWQWEKLSGELAELGYRPGLPQLTGPFAICPADLGPAQLQERADT